jgi:hypothetical protein
MPITDSEWDDEAVDPDEGYDTTTAVGDYEIN